MLRLIFVCIMTIALSVSAAAGEVTIAAGVGLKDVVNDIAAAFTKKHPSVRILKNYAPSGVLAKQLDGGGNMDVLFVANVGWMNYMKEKKHVDPATVMPFAYNTLVFVSSNPHGPATLNDVTKLNRIAIGSPKSVPAGEYAIEAFKKAGIDKQLENKLVMARDVRECLMYAERGEVDGAFVYKTDALHSRQVTVRFTVPQELFSRVVYMTALTVSGTKNQDAKDFFSFLQSDEARSIIRRHGFVIR